MQNTIKSLQQKSDHIHKLEDKGSKTIVIELGSHSIKIGFANEKAPFIVSPFIAYKKTQTKEKCVVTQQGFDYQFFKGVYQKAEEELKTSGVISSDNKPFKGKPRAKQVVSIDRIPNPLLMNVLYGDDALRVEYNPAFIFRKIITHGCLNIEDESKEKERVSDLQNLITWTLKTKIKIPEKEWTTFNCVFIVPDLFIRRHLKMIISSLFRRIGFKKLYVHLESVMACFGSTISSACVVDIGHEKINICCVDEGVIIPHTLVKKNFGSQDLSKILCRLFNEKINDPHVYPLRSTSQADLFLIGKVKQIACAVKDPEQTINRMYQISPIRGQNQYAVQIPYSDAVCVASNSFFTEMWNAFEMPQNQDPFNPYSKYYDLYEDPQDFFEEYSGGGFLLTVGPENVINDSLLDPFIYQPLEQLVLASLASIRDPDARKKFSSNILVIGGGAHLPKLMQQLLVRLNKKLQSVTGFEEKAELATDLVVRQIAPIHSSWLGGTVIPKLDSLRDLWIERGKYIGCLSEDDDEEEENILDRKLFTRKQQSQEWGIRYLKQKVPFLW